MVAGSGFTLQRPLPTCVGVLRVLSQANPRSHLYSRTPGQHASGLLIQLCGAQRFKEHAQLDNQTTETPSTTH